MEMGGKKDRWACASVDHGRVQTEWVQGKRLEIGIEGTDAWTCADGAGAREMLYQWVGRSSGGHQRARVRRRVRTVGCKGKVGKRSGEGPMGMSERGCADVFCRRCGCKGKVKWVGGGTGMSERGCAEVCRQFGCKEKVGNGPGEGPVGMSARGCADLCGRCGCKEKVGNGGVDARTFADGVGARERLEMGREKDRWA